MPRQFPDVGGDDLYYGGTAYKNTGGIGVQIATEADGGATIAASDVSLPGAPVTGDGDLLVVPTVQLYNLEATFLPSVEELMAARTSAPYVEINAADAEADEDRRWRLGAGEGRRKRGRSPRARQRQSAGRFGAAAASPDG